MPFWELTRMSARNYVLDRGQDQTNLFTSRKGDKLRMRHFIKFIWPCYNDKRLHPQLYPFPATKRSVQSWPIFNTYAIITTIMNPIENIQRVVSLLLCNCQKLLVPQIEAPFITHFLRKKSAVSVPIGLDSSSELDDSDSLDLSHISSLSPSDSCKHATSVACHTQRMQNTAVLTVQLFKL